MCEMAPILFLIYNLQTELNIKIKQVENLIKVTCFEPTYQR